MRGWASLLPQRRAHRGRRDSPHDIVAPGVKHTPIEKLFPDHKDEIVTCASVSKTFNLAGMAYSNIIIHDPISRHSGPRGPRRTAA